MSVSLETLTAKDGDILILSGGYATPEFRQEMRRRLDARGLGKCSVIFCETSVKVEAIDPDALRAAGWVKETT